MNAIGKDKLEELLAGYIDQTLDDAQRKQVESFLASNPDVAKIVERMTADAQTLSMLPRRSAPSDLSDVISAKAERQMLLGESATPIGAGRRLGPPLLAAAAVILVAGGVAMFAWQILGNRPTSEIAKAIERDEPVATATAARPEPMGPPAPELPGIAPTPATVAEQSAATEALADAAMPASRAPSAPLRMARERSESFAFEPAPAEIEQIVGFDDPAPAIAIVVESEKPEAAEMIAGAFLIDRQLRSSVALDRAKLASAPQVQVQSNVSIPIDIEAAQLGKRAQASRVDAVDAASVRDLADALRGAPGTTQVRLYSNQQTLERRQQQFYEQQATTQSTLTTQPASTTQRMTPPFDEQVLRLILVVRESQATSPSQE